MNGPLNEAEARQAQAELVRIRDRHAFYCRLCLDARPCELNNLWVTTINAAAVLAETARVVDRDGTED